MQVKNLFSTRISRSLSSRTVLAITIAVTIWLLGVEPAAAQTGRPFTSDDWTDKIPVVFGAILVVIIVNSIGMYFVFRSRRAERQAGQS